MKTKRMFEMDCSWLEVDGERYSAPDVKEALAMFGRAHGVTVDVTDTWEAEPGEPAGGAACFTGQTWTNGDFNTEFVTARELTREQVWK